MSVASCRHLPADATFFVRLYCGDDPGRLDGEAMIKGL